MITQLETDKQDIAAFSFSGTVSREDYAEVLEPALKNALEESRKIRLFLYFGPNFTGFTAGAAWRDLQVGRQYMSRICKSAIVSDTDWLRTSAAIIGSMLPIEVKTFKDESYDDAMAWLDSGPIALDYELQEQTGLLILRIESAISAEQIQAVTNVIDNWLERDGRLRGLLIQMKKFPGWENLGAALRHLRFIRNHHHEIPRVAFAADGAMAKLMPQIAQFFVSAEVKQFAHKEAAKARQWLLDD